MKIGFVLDDTLDSTDGVQQYVLTLGEWLAAAGHVVHYLVGESSRTDLANLHSLSRNVKVRFNGNRMSIPLPANSRRIRSLLTAEKFDVLHVQVPYSPMMASRVILNAPASTAVVGTFHIAPHTGIVSVATHLLALWLHRSLKRFSTMLSVSVAAQSFARRTFGVQSTVLPNVVVRSRFASAEAYPLPGEGPVVMFLGRLVPRKGCMLLVQAVLKLRSQHPDQPLRVVICGRGPLEPELRAYVAEAGLERLVSFAGYLSEADKPRYLRAADIAVFPSSGGESFGIVLLEAMAAAHPVVLGAANEGYAAVLSEHPESLFAVGDADALAAKLYTYLTDAAAAQEDRAWQDGFINQFDVDVVGRQLVAVYESAIARAAGSMRE